MDRFGKAIRWALRTPTRRWTVGGLFIGLLVALQIPAMGLAVAGGAVAIWGWAVAGLTAIGGLIGNAVGANKEKKALQKQKANG